jgi:hypothetical protein
MESDGTLRFEGTPEELTQLAYKNVLLAGVTDKTPYGFVRMVTSVETTTDELAVHTVPAPIQFAFRKLDVKFTRTIPDIAEATSSAKRVDLPGKSSRRAKELWTTLPLNFPVFDGDGDPNTEDDQVYVTGHLSGGVDYTFGISVDWGDVFDIPEELAECAKSLFTSCTVEDLMPEAKVGFSLIGGVNADLNMKGVSFLPYKRTIPIDHKIYDPIKIGPLWFFPELDVAAEIEGAASSRFALSSTIDLSAGAEVAYSNKTGPSVVPPHINGFTIDSPTVEAVLDAYTKVRLGPKLALKLYGVAGPYAGVYGFVKLNANQFEEPCWTLDGGVEGELGFVIGVDIPLFGTITIADWHEPVDIWSTNATSGSCSGTSTGALSPFQQPAFTPWARSYSNTVTTTGLPYSGPGGGNVWTDLQRTIDGHHVLSGSGAKALLKIDRDGGVVWSKRFDGPTLGDIFIDEMLPDRVTHTQDAGMFVSAYPWALLKMDSTGSLLWAKQFPFAPNSDWWRVSDLEADGSGGFYLVAGYGVDPIYPVDVDALVARLDGGADILWVQRVGDPKRGEVPRVIIPFDDGIIVAGSRWDVEQPGSWRLWAVRLGNDGTLLWKKEYPVIECGTSYETSLQPLTGHQADDGDLILGGTIDGAPQRSFFAKIKPDGTSSFLTSYKKVSSLNLEDLSLSSLTPLPTSGYLATGTYLPYPYDLEPDFWIGYLDGIGQFQWTKRLKSPDYSSELLPAVQYTDDGGLLVAGYSETLAGGNEGFWSVKTYAKDGTISFSQSSGVSMESLDLTQESYCPSSLDWNAAVQPMSVDLIPIQVTVEDLPVTTASQSP